MALDAWSRQYLGWANPNTPVGDEVLSLPLPLSAASAPVRLNNFQNSPTEYFLAETRHPTGWDRGMVRYLGSTWPGGVLIQHIDTTVGSPGSNNINRYVAGGHQGVVPVQASTTDCEMLAPGSTCRGAATTLFYSGNNANLTPQTTPSSNNYDGGSSAISLTQISAPGATMTAALSYDFTCAYVLSPASAMIDADGGPASVSVTTFPTCEWTATSNNAWITLTSGASGTGNGAVAYSVAANTGAQARTGSLTIGGQTFTVTQGAPGIVTTLQNGVSLTGLAGALNSETFYKIVLPEGAEDLSIQTSGSTGDCDLYVRFGSMPTQNTWDYRPYMTGSTETVTVAAPVSGKCYIMLHGYESYSG